MNGRTFEGEVAELLCRLGYDARLTKARSDGGIDIIAYKDGLKIAVQCKAHKNKISESVARDLYGVMHANDFDKGIIATTHGASANTYSFIKDLTDKPRVILTSYDLVEMEKAATNTEFSVRGGIRF